MDNPVVALFLAKNDRFGVNRRVDGNAFKL